MRGVTRQIDSCNGKVLDTINSSVYANNSLIAVCGATIKPHAPWYYPHIGKIKIVTCSSHTFASGVGMAREQDK
jgi:hypothetical protein